MEADGRLTAADPFYAPGYPLAVLFLDGPRGQQ
jgi:hypothetical protein